MGCSSNGLNPLLFCLCHRESVPTCRSSDPSATVGAALACSCFASQPAAAVVFELEHYNPSASMLLLLLLLMLTAVSASSAAVLHLQPKLLNSQSDAKPCPPLAAHTAPPSLEK
jgi:hypothetical protein